MELFRRKQKIIFWIVTIIIVPSFVLVWGVGDIGRGRNHIGTAEIGTVNGKTISYPEFEAFQKRMRAAIGGLPLQFANAPGGNSPQEELFKYIFAYSLLEDAEKAGFTASDLQVGTYIENSHPTISAAINKNDPQSKERAVDSLVRQLQITRAEFIRGVREWQTIGNYIQADSNIAAVNDEEVFTFYALNRGESIIKRLHFVETESVRERAKKEIMAMPEEALDTAVRDHIAANADKQRFRNSSQWRFAYVFMPFVPESSVRPPTEDEIKERYEAGASTLFAGKTLAEAHDQIKADLLREEMLRMTLRNFTVDVDAQLREQGPQLALPELVKLTPLAKYNVTTGDTGPQLLDVAEVVKAIPQGSSFSFTQFLEAIDAAPEAMREQYLNEWKSGFILEGRPYQGDAGLFRLRLLDYQPSYPMEIDTPEGTVKPELFEIAVADLIGERAAEMVMNEALAMEEKIRAHMEALERGEPVPDPAFADDFNRMPTETFSYLEITESDKYPLIQMPIGDVLGPVFFRDSATGEQGQELLVMVDRRIPTREAFAAEPDEVKQRYRQIAISNFRGGYGFTYGQSGPVAIIQPSPAVMAGLVDRYNKKQISVHPQWLTGGEG